MVDPPPLPTGLAARYRPLRVLGQGGFGEVVLVRDQEIGREVALKLLRLSPDPEVLRRFEREARTTSRLHHPHIITLLDQGFSEGQAFIVYEFIEGPTLGAQRGGPRPPSGQVEGWGRQVAEALAVAHRAGVIHRDVKPDNILLRGPDDAVLCDFGIARTTRQGTMMTAEGVILGTPGFMAPELFLGSEPSPASDQFGLAATLFEVMVREPVHGTYELAGVVSAIQKRRSVVLPVELKQRAPRLHAALARALRSDPSERFADLDSFARALRSSRGPTEVEPAPTKRIASPGVVQSSQLPPTPPASSGRPPARGRRGAAPWVVLGVGLFLVGAGGAWRASSPPSPQANPSPPAARVDERVLEQERRSLEEHLAWLARGHQVPQGIPHPSTTPPGFSCPDPEKSLLLRELLMGPGDEPVSGEAVRRRLGGLVDRYLRVVEVATVSPEGGIDPAIARELEVAAVWLEHEVTDLIELLEGDEYTPIRAIFEDVDRDEIHARRERARSAVLSAHALAAEVGELATKGGELATKGGAARRSALLLLRARFATKLSEASEVDLFRRLTEEIEALEKSATPAREAGLLPALLQAHCSLVFNERTRGLVEGIVASPRIPVAERMGFHLRALEVAMALRRGVPGARERCVQLVAQGVMMLLRRMMEYPGARDLGGEGREVVDEAMELLREAVASPNSRAAVNETLDLMGYDLSWTEDERLVGDGFWRARQMEFARIAAMATAARTG